MLHRWMATAAFVALAAAGCGSDAAETTRPAPTNAQASVTTSETTQAAPDTTVTTSEPPDVSEEGSATDLAVTEVVFGEHVTITNLGGGSVNVDGLWLCNRPFYTPMPAVVIGPGVSLDVPAAELGDMPTLGGEAALYISDDFESAEAMLDYVAWGRGGGRTRAAVERGLWPEGDLVAPVGSSIVSPRGGSSSDDWE